MSNPNSKNNRGLFAIGTVISLVAMIAMLVYMPAGFWIFLPFVVAFAGKAFDII